MSDYENDKLLEEAESDWDKDWFPEQEPNISIEDYEQEICTICHSVINEDGTADNCAGECDRGLPPVDDNEPLDFN